MSIKILDLFAGAGGLSLGFEMVRDQSGDSVFEVHRAVELDSDACDTLRNRYGADRVIQGDLTRKEIHRQIIDECEGVISILVGGIPCQSFSLIGPRSGFGKQREKFKNDNRDNLYHEYRDIVRELRPNVIVIENVKGILSKKDENGGKIFDSIISDLVKFGYNFRNSKTGKNYMLLNAADYGVPQRRERVILVGIRKNWKDIDVPFVKPTHADPNAIKEDLFGAALLPWVTLSEAIGDLPGLTPKITFTGVAESDRESIRRRNKRRHSGKDRVNFDEDRLKEHLSKVSAAGRDYLEFIRPDGYSFIDHHTARSQQLSDMELFMLMKQGETARYFAERKPELAKRLIKYKMDNFTDKYRRQKSDEPCTCILAHLQKDGNRFIHPWQARTITPREAARIQSFPDDFTFAGSQGSIFRQIGNAVPPLLAKRIAESIMSAEFSEGGDALCAWQTKPVDYKR